MLGSLLSRHFLVRLAILPPQRTRNEAKKKRLRRGLSAFLVWILTVVF